MKHLRLFKTFTLLLAFYLIAGNVSGQVVISQVYGGGGNSGATYTHDFIELFNRGTSDIDLTGWSVQYASATGTSWQITSLTATTLAPGQYYLIQQAQGSGGTTPLPTPDAVGTIAMSATAGKVALVSSTTALSGACPLGGSVLDFVGFGTNANCFEGSGPSPAPSNTNSVIRLNAGCTDTDNNASDFIASAPTPRNTASPFNNCGVSIVETPTFNPPGGVYSSAQNVVIATTTPGAQIYYTTDGTDPDENSTLYMGPVNISGNITTLKARAYATGFNPSLIQSAIYYIPFNVSNIATLRASAMGSAYKLTGQAVLTFQQTFRNQKYIQDATAAILVDDPPAGGGNFGPGIISTSYNVGDGITGITGILNEFGNMMQFVPVVDPGTATSTGNVITPQVVTLSQLNSNFDDYEAKLVKIMNVSFTNAGGTFANGQVYPITDGSKANFNFRTTFFDVDYIGTDIPFTTNIICLPNSRTDGDFVTSRFLADIESTGLPFFTKAYAVSSTAVDVLYNFNMTSVDPDDYYLLGTANTIFTAAAIDGVNPKLVHLTGASPAMSADIILDEVYDDNVGTSYQFYAGISPIANTNTANPGGTMLNGVDATFTGIVSGNNGTSKVWVSDAAGAYSGVLIFNNTFPSQVAVGDNITFTALRDDFNNLTQLINPTLISVNSPGNTPYGPTLIPGSDIASSIPANTNPAESFEGQLVKIEDFTVDSLSAFGTNYACSWSDGFNTYVFYIGNGAGNFILDVGSAYTAVTGLVDWFWNGNFYRINPRNQDDVESDFIPPVKLAITSVNDGFDPSENHYFSVAVQAQDADGDPAITLSNITFTFSTNGGTNGDVDFTSGSTTVGTILAGTNEVIVYGVRMAPTGANVTITASDNDPAGLQSGTSDPFDILILPEMLAAWTFDETPASPNTPTSVPANLGFQVGSATLYADGTNGSSLWNAAELTVFVGTTINDPRTDGSAIAGFAYTPRGAADLTGNGKSMVIKFSMENFKDPILSFATRGTSTGFDLHQWEWSIDNITYTPFGTNTATRSTNFSPRVLNMSAIDQIDQAPEVYLRVTFDGATTSTGNNRLDNIVIRATEVGDFDFAVDLKVFLEGPFDLLTNSMATTLNSENLLPNNHPFNPALPYYENNTPKWLYNGPGSVVSFNPGVVDWVMVELRDAPAPAAATSATTVASKPGLLLSDGSIVALNGTSNLEFNATFDDLMFIVVWSRNHLAVMSSAGIANPTGTVSWDFTTGAGQTFGTDGSKELTTGVWGMYSGDVNADGTINNDDKTPDGWNSEAGEQGYLGSDLNLDSQSDNVDKNDFWLPNNTKNSQVPN